MSPQREPKLPPQTPTAHARRLLLALGLWGALHLIATLGAAALAGRLATAR